VNYEPIGNKETLLAAHFSLCEKEDVIKRNSKTMISFFTLLILLCVVISSSASDFCDGFEKGYKAGYKHAHGTSLDPLVPVCPLQPLKNPGDPKSDFDYGYIVGIEKGTGK
jgi:hypothetical protein